MIFPVMLLHRPYRPGVAATKREHLPNESSADSRILVISVSLPPGKKGSYQTGKARTVDLEIPFEGFEEKSLFKALADVRVTKIETILPMGIGRRKNLFGQKRALLAVLLEKRCPRNRGVEHKLMEIGIVAYGMFHDCLDVLGRVVLQTNDGGPEDANAVRLEVFYQGVCVDAL